MKDIFFKARLQTHHGMAMVSLALFLVLGCETTGDTTQKSLVPYVNPLIGTAPATTTSALKHGHGKENNAQVVPYVTVPFGMTNWTPQTKATETKCHAPYYYTDSIIQGFRGSHWLSGSCVQDYGSMTIMPISGDLKCLPQVRGSKFSHKKERATPFVYEVELEDYDVTVEMTATKRSGLFKFTYNKSGDAHVVVNPNSDEGEGFVQILPESNEIVGYNPVHRIYQGWGEPAGFSGYFVVRFARNFKSYGVYHQNDILEEAIQIANKKNIGGYASFTVKPGEIIEAVVGTSFTSIDHARSNLEHETHRLNFESAKANLKTTWESLLAKVRVEGGSEKDKTTFYTALYHSYLQPRTFNDADGTYTSFAGGQQLLNTGGSDHFTDFSMWDTYRASHPLFNLLTPTANAQMMNSLFLMAEQGGWLPIFPCWNHYTSAMIGDHVIATVADAYVKGVIDLSDQQYAYLLKNAFESPEDFEAYKQGKGRRALESYLKYGYVPLEDPVEESFHINEQVSRTLEYAFDDFALSRVAKKRGDIEQAEILTVRARNYRHVYSVQDSCVRGKYANGSFIADFDKYVRQPFITEGTPYQYTWYVPHDVHGLVKLMGGEKGFNQNLDNFHMAGQYWHGNEPGHQIPFLYNFSGEPWKTQKLVDHIMKTEYSSEVGGLSGNDDAGQMSAWYVFAALGFYPVAPSVPEYVISGPHFDKITIALENGKELVINAPGASKGKKYIQSLKVNGVPITKNYLNHFDMMDGGVLDFEMGEQPNQSWGTQKEDRPFSLTD
ncbi:GH92 family glycosyl hydrolase [Allomuricauda sp. SCSIO 65647]|uniref:GH92 family glycosyl hydrolase n=1 Tax=Allomuricauda sp. SCSIO 65647 TaxID=2908843 RepID=UPI001F35A4D7|nr:GH92 family glycosyl hydrolase [Muricauda sp. SCSIO 65647]UJH68578.1 GH92 family glycosyl hydrolase [Muricauda sp. SCSIO 65647]